MEFYDLTTISRNRFSEILRFLPFDIKSYRSQRLKTDRFALFLVVWNRFIDNCISCFTPRTFITVDEKFFPSKCRYLFTQFMALKPNKYGQKYWLAVDKDSKYVVNGFPYVGGNVTRSRDERASDHVVMRLLKSYLNKKRNVGHRVAKIQYQLSGTVNRIRKEEPAVVKHMKEPLYSITLYKFRDVTMTAYEDKTKKNVVIFSTPHQNITTADNAKKTPESVKAYNVTKYGVDKVDQMAKKYTARTSTRRWLIHSFQNTLDLAAINAWIVYKAVTKNNNISRRVFLQQLAQDLSGPHIDERSNTKKRRLQEETFDEGHSKMTKYCQVKGECQKNRTVGTCHECSKSLC